MIRNVDVISKINASLHLWNSNTSLYFIRYLRWSFRSIQFLFKAEWHFYEKRESKNRKVDFLILCRLILLYTASLGYALKYHKIIYVTIYKSSIFISIYWCVLKHGKTCYCNRIWSFVLGYDYRIGPSFIKYSS